MQLILLLLLLCGTAGAQTLGQLRLVDFSPRTAAVVQTATGSGPIVVATASAHGLSTGSIYVYPPISWDTDENNGVFRNHGNRGRGYFNITVTDSTHFTITSEMYTGATAGIGNGIAAGDKIVPLTTYYVRQGPKLYLDGPVNKGAWSGGTTYRALESVTAPDGNLYESIADGNLNHQPPNTAWWVQLDPLKTGPGTFTASLRNSSGKANESNYAWTRLKTLQSTNWPASNNYMYGVSASYQQWPGGFGGILAAQHWMGDGDATSYAQALVMATQAEDLAEGTVGCAVGVLSCGHSKTSYDSLDQTRLDLNASIPGGLALIYDTLTPAQKAGLLDRLLNDNDPAHNGTDPAGCTPAAFNPGTGSISGANFVITGSGFLSLDGLLPGAIIQTGDIAAARSVSLGRVKSVDSDTQITLERSNYSQVSGATPVVFASWAYVKPFGYGGQHTCGAVWLYRRYASSPRMIPGLETQYATSDFPPNSFPDDSPRQNKTISGLAYLISTGLLTANDDLRGVRMAEQGINYFMTQTLAQENKSRHTGLDGHGTQYGLGRTGSWLASTALSIKNSLTVTPPGVITGNWLKNLMQATLYATWLSHPWYVQPWATGYGVDTNSIGVTQMTYIGPPLGIIAAIYPDDPFVPHVAQYMRTRMNDIVQTGGWSSVSFMRSGWLFYDPTVTPAPLSSEPPQRSLNVSDIDECIAAGLYCRADAAWGGALSNTGWDANTDTQVLIEGGPSLPPVDDDGYGTAGNITILQNHGTHSAYLLGGNGLGVGASYGSANTPHSGLYDGNTISIYNPTVAFNTPLPTGRDLVSSKAGFYAFANTDRWAGNPVTGAQDNSYVYLRVNYTPQMRQATTNYNRAQAVQKSFFAPAAQAQNVTREVFHLKSGSGMPNFIVAYDWVKVGTPNQLRAYWHLQTATYLPTVRHVEWVSVNGTAQTATLTNPTAGRLNVAALPVAGSANSSIALTSEDFNPPWDSTTTAKPSVLLYGQLASIASWTWASGVLTMTMTAAPFGAFPLPTDGSVSIKITLVNPSSVNGTYPVIGYNATGPKISIAVANDPGAFVSGGYVQYPGWCSYPTTYNPSGSCAGMYWRPYAGSTPLPDSPWPGTYRLQVCASTDGGKTCGNATEAEWITVLQPSASTTSSMPPLNQPPCSGTTGTCTALEILDGAHPKVIMLARKGALATALAITSTHSGTAHYTASGLAAGSYTVTRGGVAIANAIVTAGDTTLSFYSTAGAILVNQTGGTPPPGALALSPSALQFTCPSSGTAPAAQNLGITGTGVALDNWTASKTAAWLNLSAAAGSTDGSTSVSVDCTGLAAGAYTDVVTVTSTTSGVGNSPQTIPVALTRYSAPLVTTGSVSAGFVGIPYSQTLAGAGGLPFYSWDISEGTLCDGLVLSVAGVISGTPTRAQECAFTARLTDSQSPPAIATAAFSITVGSTAPPITLTAEPSAVIFSCTQTGTNPIPQSVAVSSTGGSDDWSATSTRQWLSAIPNSGSLPGSVDLVVNCTGLPAGNYSDSVLFTSTTGNVVNGPVSVSVLLTVELPPWVTTSVLPTATWESAYQQTLDAAGGQAPYIWTLASGGLPLGVSLAGTGLLSGTPAEAGTFHFTVLATDAGGATALKPLDIVVRMPTAIVQGAVSVEGAAVIR